VHVTSSPAVWYAARAGGVAAYLMLSVVVSLGLTMSGRVARSFPKFALQDVHRFAGLLTGAFIGLHVVTIAIDSWLPFSIGQIVVPFTDRYRPLWVGLGIIAAELLLALAITNHYRDRLPYRFWRRAHYLNFAVWGAATVHGIASGTDRNAPWLLAVYALSATTVAVLLGLRVTGGRLAPVTAGAAAATVVISLAVAPFHVHRRAWNAARFTDSLSGQILVQQGVTEGIVSMAGTGGGQQRVLVRADLLVRPQRLAATAFQLEYLPSGTLCKGTVQHVRPTGFDAVCRLPRGARRFVTAGWRLTSEQGALEGSIVAHP
jgi:methionine sulfoxide reductase heme-binding subunit